MRSSIADRSPTTSPARSNSRRPARRRRSPCAVGWTDPTGIIMPIDRRDLGRLSLAATCWGVGTVISKAALDEFAPLTLLAVQLGSSLIVLALLLRLQGAALLAGAPPRLARLGLLNPGLAYALSLLGLATITASLSVLLWALEPLLIMA